MFSKEAIQAIVDLFSRRGVMLYHACQLTQFEAYLRAGALGSNAAREQTGAEVEDDGSSPAGEPAARPLGVYLADPGASFARDLQALPALEGPIVFQLKPAALESAAELAVCLKPRDAADFDPGRHTLAAPGDVANLFKYTQEAPLPEKSFLKSAAEIRAAFHCEDAAEPRLYLTPAAGGVPFGQIASVWVDNYLIAKRQLRDWVHAILVYFDHRFSVQRRYSPADIGGLLANRLAACLQTGVPSLADFGARGRPRPAAMGHGACTKGPGAGFRNLRPRLPGGDPAADHHRPRNPGSRRRHFPGRRAAAVASPGKTGTAGAAAAGENSPGRHSPDHGPGRETDSGLRRPQVTLPAVRPLLEGVRPEIAAGGPSRLPRRRQPAPCDPRPRAARTPQSGQGVPIRRAPSPHRPFAITNIRLFIAFRIFFNARFYYPVFTILFLDFGLSLEQFALLNVVWAVTIVLLEVPSGALADVIGRRNLLVGSGMLMVVEMAILCFAPLGKPNLLFTLFLVNRILSGTAEAAASGADEAIAYDSLKKEGDTRDWGKVLEFQMRAQSLAFIGVMSVGAAVYDPLLVQKVGRLAGDAGSTFAIGDAALSPLPLAAHGPWRAFYGAADQGGCIARECLQRRPRRPAAMPSSRRSG